MSEIRDRSVVRSSVIPSAKYCCSGSLLRLANGSTTIDRRGAATGGGLDVVDDALVLSRRGMMGSRGWMRFSRGCGRTAIGWQRHLPPAASSGPGVPNQGRDGTAFLDDDTAPPTAIFDDALPWRIQVGAVGLCAAPIAPVSASLCRRPAAARRICPAPNAWRTDTCHCRPSTGPSDNDPVCRGREKHDR